MSDDLQGPQVPSEEPEPAAPEPLLPPVAAAPPPPPPPRSAPTLPPGWQMPAQVAGPGGTPPKRGSGALWVILALLLVGVVTIGAIGMMAGIGPDSAGSSLLSGKVGVIPIEGVIMDGGRGGFLVGPSGARAIMEDLREAAKDDSLQAIIILVNSPGGSPAASHAIYEEIERLRTKKPVVCCMTDVAASGGYYVASACDKIVAQGSTLTGSIGVIFGGMAYYGLMQKLGLSNATQTAGKYKDVGSPLRPMRPEEKALMQAMLDDIYGQFVAAVAKGRKLDEAKVRKLAEGRVYTGAQAKAVGLVDQLGNFYDALKLAGELAHIKGEPKVEYLGEPGGLFGGVLGSSERFGGLLGGRGSLLQPQLPALQGPMLVLPYVYEMVPVVSGMQR